MVGAFVEELIRGKVDEARGEVWEHDDLFFFVDWREEEQNIPGYCDALLGPGLVAASWRGDDLVFSCADRSTVVPLTHSPADRHIALLSLNEVLSPLFEIRYVWASHGADSAALLPLAAHDWQSLLSEYGATALDMAFLKLQQAPNLFTDALVRPKPKPRWKFW